MAIGVYNGASKLLLTMLNSTLKAVLLDSNAIIDESHVSLSQITNANAWEVYSGEGTEWPQGGKTLATPGSVSFDSDSSGVADDVKITLADLVFIPTVTIGPFRHIVITVDDVPYAYRTYDEDQYYNAGYSCGIAFQNGFLTSVLKLSAAQQAALDAL